MADSKTSRQISVADRKPSCYVQNDRTSMNVWVVLVLWCLIELLLTSSDCHTVRAQETGTLSHTSNPNGPNTNPSSGMFHALIVLVQFPEHATRELPSASYFETLCANKIVPYMLDQSYGRYQIQDCDVLPWTMTNASQTFYANNESNMKGADRAADFAAPVLDQWDANPDWDWSKYDANQDGLLDSIMFVHSGWSAEMAEGLECDAAPWEQRLRSQAFPYSDNSWQSQRPEGVRLFGYGIVSALRNVCDSTPAKMDVITHEWLHTFGPVDLYDTSQFVWQIPGGIGSFDIMANADGPRYDGTPGSMSPYSKMMAGWLEPIEIVYDGVYTARSSNQYPDVYVIQKGYGEGEFLLIENRYVFGWDVILPGNGGLLIYHVDEDMIANDRPGHPSAPYWPYDHYRVALLQADSYYDLEQGINNGDAGDYFSANTMPLLPGGKGNFPNTDSYQFGDLVQTGISIIDISEPGETMTFRVTGLGSAPPETAPLTADSGDTDEDENNISDPIQDSNNGNENQTTTSPPPVDLDSSATASIVSTTRFSLMLSTLPLLAALICF